MQQIRVKIIPGMGSADGKWELIGLDKFLLRYSPGLSMYVHCTNQFPPFNVLNEELMSGGGDQGMSGGCIWKPFTITHEEYEELRDEMLTNPAYSLIYDKDLESKNTLRKWRGAVVSRYNPRKT